MSAGTFINPGYEMDDGQKIRIRIQPETVTTWNPVSAQTDFALGFPSAKVSKGRRETGIGARFAVLKWKTTPPAGYKVGGTVKVPILTSEAYDGLALGEEVEYLGAAAEVLSKSPEAIK